MALDSVATLVAIVGLVAVVHRTLNLPGEGLDREIGVWVALVGSLTTLGGGLLGMRSEGRPAARWRPGDPSPVATTPLPPPKPDTPESGGA
jgi:hypothetical protein